MRAENKEALKHALAVFTEEELEELILTAARLSTLTKMFGEYVDRGALDDSGMLSVFRELLEGTDSRFGNVMDEIEQRIAAVKSGGSR